MAKKFILHAGFHKTGTTALQHSLFAKKNELRNLGIDYPKIYNHAAAWGLNGTTWGWGQRGGQKYTDESWKNFAAKVNSSKLTRLASSEFFSEATLESIQRIKKDIAAEEFQIIFTMRPLASIFISQYQQYLKYGLKLTYEEWLHEMLDAPGKSKFNPSFWKRNMQSQVLQNWASVFGEENIKVIVADEKQPDQLYKSFAKAIGAPEDLLEKAPSGLNRSLTVEESELLRQVNLQFPQEREWSDYKVFIRDTAIANLTSTPFPTGGQKPNTPKWAVDAISAISEDQIQNIESKNYVVFGDLNKLREVNLTDGVNELPVQVPIQSAVTALLAFETNVISRVRIKRLLKEVMQRANKRFKKGLR